MAVLSMNGNKEFRPNQTEEKLQLFLAAMPVDMNLSQLVINYIGTLYLAGRILLSIDFLTAVCIIASAEIERNKTVAAYKIILFNYVVFLKAF